MSSTPPTPNEHTEYYRQVLHDLIAMATDLARNVHAEAMAAAARGQEAANAALPPPPSSRPPSSRPPSSPPPSSRPPAANTPDPAVAFDRIARTIRRTITLARHLDEPAHPAHQSQDPGQRRVAARKRIIREVQDVIQRNALAAETTRLDAELHDHLDSPDLDDEIDTRPVADIIADICHDLCVAVPYAENWKRRTPQDVETLNARAAAPAPPGPSIPRPVPDPRRPKLKPPPSLSDEDFEETVQLARRLSRL